MWLHHIVTQGVSVRISIHLHAIHDVMCMNVRWLFLVCLSPVSIILIPFLFHCPPVLCPALHLQCRQRRGLKPLHSRTMRKITLWQLTILSQVMSPNSSTTSTTQKLLQQSSKMNPPKLETELSYTSDAELDDEIIGKKTLSSSLFTQERENQRTWDKTPVKKLCCQFSPFTHTEVQGDRVLSSCQKRKSNRDMENEKIRILSEKQKEQILAEIRTDIQKHGFQADSDEMSEIVEVSAWRNGSYPHDEQPMNIIGTKSGSSWISWEKTEWNGRIHAISRVYIRYNLEEKIGRRSRYYPWTHWQDSRIAERS